MVALISLMLLMLKNINKVDGENTMIMSMHLTELLFEEDNYEFKYHSVDMEIIVMIQNYTFTQSAEELCGQVEFEWELNQCRFNNNQKYTIREGVVGVEMKFRPGPKVKSNLTSFMLGLHKEKLLLQ